MYAFIEGKLEYSDENTAVINAGGVGYEIMISADAAGKLPAAGSKLRLYTYMSVSENSGVSLFGFPNRDEQEMFKLLITVSGVGPKGAQAILGGMDTDTLRFAVLSEDAKTIAKAPGVGKKTAERIIIDLKDKLNLMDAFEKKLENTGVAADTAGLDAAREDAVLALVALGYSRTESLQAVQKVSTEGNPDADRILSESLKYLI